MDCQHFSYNRSEIFSPPGRFQTGFDGKPWSSLDMSNHMFCGDSNALSGAKLSALLVSMQRVGATVGTILAGFLPNRFGRKRSMQCIICANSVLLVVLVFADQPALYGVTLALCEACSGFIMTVVSCYGIEVIGPKWRVYFGAVGTISYSLCVRKKT